MASQRHKREQHFFDGPVDGDDPAPPQDSADEKAEQYGETPQWPDEDRDRVGSIAPADVTVRTPTTLPSRTAEIQYATSGAVLTAAGTVSVSVTLDNGSAVPFTVTVAKGDQGHQIAVAVAAAPEWAANDITTSVSGAKVVLDAGAGHEITALTSSVA